MVLSARPPAGGYARFLGGNQNEDCTIHPNPALEALKMRIRLKGWLKDYWPFVAMAAAAATIPLSPEYARPLAGLVFFAGLLFVLIRELAVPGSRQEIIGGLKAIWRVGDRVFMLVGSVLVVVGVLYGLHALLNWLGLSAVDILVLLGTFAVFLLWRALERLQALTKLVAELVARFTEAQRRMVYMSGQK
jgi:hypothetical protein